MKQSTKRLSIHKMTIRNLANVRGGMAAETDGSCRSECTSCWNSETGVCVTRVSCKACD